MTRSASPAAEGAVPPTGGKASGGHLRRFLAIDTRESFITRAQTATGQSLITLTGMLAVAPYFGTWAAALAVGGAMAAAARPNLRGPILFAATWITAFIATGISENDTLDNIVAVMQQEQVSDLSPVALAIGFLLLFITAVTGVLHWVRRSPQSVFARRPLLTLLTLEALLCGLATLDLMQGLPRVVLWAAIFTLTPYLWFLPYVVVDARSRAPSSTLLQLAVLRPFWNFTYIPFGKGVAFLRKHLAQTPQGTGHNTAQGSQAAALGECALCDEKGTELGIRSPDANSDCRAGT